MPHEWGRNVIMEGGHRHCRVDQLHILSASPFFFVALEPLVFSMNGVIGHGGVCIFHMQMENKRRKKKHQTMHEFYFCYHAHHAV